MMILRNFLLFTLVLVLMSVAALVGYNLAFNKLIFPRTTIAGAEVSGLDKESALSLIELYYTNDPNNVILRGGREDNVRLTSFEVNRNFVWAVDQALGMGRAGNLLTRLNDQIMGLKDGRDINVPIKYDADELEGILDQVEDEMNTEPVWPKLTIEKEEVVLVEGKNGMRLIRDTLRSEILRLLALPGKHLLDVPMQVVMAEEEEVQANKAKEAAKKWLGKKLILKGRDSQVIIDNEEILNLFGLSGTTVNETGFEALIEKITPKIETQARDAVFVFKDDRVNEFQPEIVGSKIDIPLFKQVLGETLYNPEKGELEVSLILTYPDITTGDINDLGIKELIGRGSSEFAHSIPGRVFNVNLASTRISGVLVPPGEEFSFNAVVGEISRETGYQSAYIISGGRTVLGDGGGVCQVSTTVFRAALNAGLPITERKAHAYRVGYYEQDSKPGIDATVYNPTADLKFKNDTEHHILVQTYVDTKAMKMRVDIFGTKDGRVAKISEPRVSGQTPPPATMYVDDPTLVKGTKKQIDWSAWGAKVSFDYTVEKGGQMVYEKTFYSNYQPWQAVYLVGMKE